jgi:hypothetical protein
MKKMTLLEINFLVSAIEWLFRQRAAPIREKERVLTQLYDS